MAEVTISLQRRLQQRISLLLMAVFLLIAFAALYFFGSFNQSAMRQNLVLKHQIIGQVFNGYLNRAEDEMSLITQNLSLSHFEQGRELDLLFRHHEVLLFGGLDFFYIEWRDRPNALDPRAQLFTAMEFKGALNKGLVGSWVTFLTDDAVFLMYKKKIVSDIDENNGYLYGFISLNDNLTLANELLDGAKVDEVRIYDDQERLLLKEHKRDVKLADNALNSIMPLRTSVQTSLSLEIIENPGPYYLILKQSISFILVIGGVLFTFFLLFIHQARHSIFMPLKKIDYHNKGESVYQELEPIYRKSQQDKAFIKARNERFALLMKSTHCAIIFCNEVAEIEVMNVEAQEIFPDSVDARTVFDFMPISSHRSIQQALKGEVGVSFDLTIDSLRRLYKWQAYSFINESSYQGALLVGRDITKETSLVWQLDQLQPLSTIAKKTVDAESMLNELAYLSALPHNIKEGQIQNWVRLFMSVLEKLKDTEEDISYIAIGDVLSEESALIMTTMDIESNRAFIDCPLAVGARVIAVDSNIKGLIRVLLMMVLSNDMEERCLGVRLSGDQLTITAMHDMASRRLFSWMIKTLLSHLGGRQKILQNNALELEWKVHVEAPEQGPVTLLNQKTVAWIANDYPRPGMISGSLNRLNLSIEHYISTASFFTQSGNVSKFDAILIGCDQDIGSQLEVTEALKLKYKRHDLPIIWINSFHIESPDSDVFVLSGCPFDYSLQKILSGAFKREPMVSLLPLHNEESWLLVGGSRVTKAIWHSVLSEYDLLVQWVNDLNYSNVALSYHTALTVVLLEPQPHELLLTLQSEFPNIRFFSIQNWPSMPANVRVSNVDKPHSSQEIQAFAEQVMTQSRA